MKKQLYIICIVLGSGLVASISARAQCSCANGVTPDSLVHNFTLNPTANFNSTISFPKFDPTTGTLACVNLSAAINAVSNLSIRNLDSFQRDYQFLYTQAISFTGPGGLTNFANTSLNYGPSTLDAYGTGTDSIHYGPDTPFKNYGISKTISNVAPYLGTGTVNINYTNTGSTLLLQGSNNYQSTVSTFAWGNFRLTYYWCLPSALATGMKNFSVAKKEKFVLLKWESENELPGTEYEVQMSTDAHRFVKIDGELSKTATGTESASYEFKYAKADNFEGKLFFRVKQIKLSGQAGYSTTKLIDFSSASEADVFISPNPVIRNMAINFRSPQTGQVEVEIINAVGQVIFRRSHSFNSQSRLDITISQQAQPGIYYLRIKNLNTHEQLMQKLIIR